MWPPQAQHSEAGDGIRAGAETFSAMEDDDEEEGRGFRSVTCTEIGSIFRPWRSCTESSVIIGPSIEVSEEPQKEFPEKAKQVEQGFRGSRLPKEIKEF